MKACKNCKYLLTEGESCPNCGGEEFTEKFVSFINIFDVERSELAKKIGAKIPGKYAVRIK